MRPVETLLRVPRCRQPEQYYVLRKSPDSRQAREETAELVQHDLLVRRVRRRLVPALANTDRYVTTLGIHDALVGGQRGAPARVDIRGGEDSARVDAAHDPLEVVGVCACARHLGEVDVEEDPGGQVGSPRVDDGVGQVRGQVGVDQAPGGHRHRVPGEGAVREA